MIYQIIEKITLNPRNLFLKTKTHQYSYEDLFHFAACFSTQIEKYHLQAKRPVGLCGEPSDEMIFIIASCWLLNIPFTIFNHYLPDQKIEEQTQRLQPELVITNQLENIKNQPRITFDSFNLEKVLNSSQSVNQSVIDQLLGNRISHKENIFGYFFTSGTSSAPKIVPLKRRQMISAAKSSAKNISPDSNECWLLCMPLFHVGGASIILRSLLYGSAVFHIPAFEAEKVARRLATDTHIVAVSLVPTMLKRLIENGEFAVHNHFQAVLLGGGPVSPSLIEACIIRNIPVITSYGMTETCAQIAANPIFGIPDDEKSRQSAGQIFKPNKVEIRDGQNQPVSTENSGSVWVSGPQVFDGYFEKNSDKSNDSGWFNTGDYGRMDDEGRLFIEARRTDLIITGGENVSPKEVENTLEQFKAIKEAAVFGVPDEEWGQRVVAALVPESSSTINQKVLKNDLKKELPAFKIPKQFLFVDKLPRTHNGKIRRSKLEELFASKPKPK